MTLGNDFFQSSLQKLWTVWYEAQACVSETSLFRMVINFLKSIIQIYGAYFQRGCQSSPFYASAQNKYNDRKEKPYQHGLLSPTDFLRRKCPMKRPETLSVSFGNYSMPTGGKTVRPLAHRLAMRSFNSNVLLITDEIILKTIILYIW